MKTVFTDKWQIAHLWANQTQQSARISGGNFFFEGKTIYSYGYHSPIATIHANKAGMEAVLFTTDSYSNTTSKHISVARSASSQYPMIYCKNPKQAAEGNHFENLKDFEASAKWISRSLERARKPEIYLDQIASQRQHLERYSDFFQLSKDKVYKKLINSFSYIYLTTRAESEQAAAKEKKEILKRQKERAKQIQKDLEERKKKLEVDIQKFRNHEINSVYGSDYSYLRLNPETNRIETSQRVEIPFSVAEKAYQWVMSRMIKQNFDAQEEYRILDFRVADVTENSVRIGCHLIQKEEVIRIAKECGFDQLN